MFYVSGRRPAHDSPSHSTHPCQHMATKPSVRAKLERREERRVVGYTAANRIARPGGETASSSRLTGGDEDIQGSNRYADNSRGRWTANRVLFRYSLWRRCYSQSRGQSLRTPRFRPDFAREDSSLPIEDPKGRNLPASLPRRGCRSPPN